LRRINAAAVGRWRSETRTALYGALKRGDHIIGFTTDGEYVVKPA
jgi:hypothetical protein